MAYLLYTIWSKTDNNNMKRCKFHPSWILDSVQDTLWFLLWELLLKCLCLSRSCCGWKTLD